MKWLNLILISVLLSVTAQAQTSIDSTKLQHLSFVPVSIEMSYSFSSYKYQPTQIQPNRFLLSTGWLLRSLKYDSPIDEFSALIPFDRRAFDPYSFTELNYNISKNYLLIKN